MLNADQKAMLAAFRQSTAHLTVLTGAGISAETDLPSYRPSGVFENDRKLEIYQ